MGDRLDGPSTVASLAVREPRKESDGDPDARTDTCPGSDLGSDDGGPEPTHGTGSDDEESVSDGGVSVDSGEAPDEPTDRTEPAAFDPADFAGLVVLVAIVLATLFLVRRAPR